MQFEKSEDPISKPARFWLAAGVFSPTRVPDPFLAFLADLAFMTSLLAVSTAAFAQPPEEVATAVVSSESDDPESDLALHLKSFDQVWKIVKERAWDESFDLKGWTAEGDRLRPQIQSGSSREEVREVMSELLSWLNQSHFGILPQSLYSDWAASKESSGHVGIQFRLVDGHTTVRYVFPESDAAGQGVMPGWRLLSLDGKPVSDLIELLRESLREHAERDLPMTLAFAMERQMQGGIGETLALEFEAGDGAKKGLEIKRGALAGESVQMANLPRMVIRHEVREVAPGIVSFHFDGFFAPMQIMADWKKAIALAKKGEGLILDMRGNRGGLVGMTMGIARQLATDDNLYLGTLRTKNDSLRLVMLPVPRPYVGPVAILTDEASVSAAEIIAGGLQAVGRARVFGTRTAGAALPSMVSELPNGDRFQFAIASYIDFRERCIEGNGVIPDEIIPLQRADLLKGRDAVLDAAIQWINKQQDSSPEPSPEP